MPATVTALAICLGAAVVAVLAMRLHLRVRRGITILIPIMWVVVVSSYSGRLFPEDRLAQILVGVVTVVGVLLGSLRKPRTKTIKD
jgi:uncharacterized membrane protein YfcA